MNELVLQVYFVTSAIMVGVIWMVQLVHYPAFYYVDEEKFKDFSLFHQAKITYIVGPIMIIELLSGLYLMPKADIFILSSLVLLIAIWLVTFFFSVKEHNKLLHGKDQEAIKSLILSNWARTILWSVKLGMVWFALK